jgi:hypothetical protein
MIQPNQTHAFHSRASFDLFPNFLPPSFLSNLPTRHDGAAALSERPHGTHDALRLEGIETLGVGRSGGKGGEGVRRKRGRVGRKGGEGRPRERHSV